MDSNIDPSYRIKTRPRRVNFERKEGTRSASDSARPPFPVDAPWHTRSTVCSWTFAAHLVCERTFWKARDHSMEPDAPPLRRRIGAQGHTGRAVSVMTRCVALVDEHAI
jgi:hypothetical protein